ncbi:MAG: prepilin-type N-terminal cleavage/methylation domain-containing protein [Planctomycetia bacterium]|nr:prepilin-type N-terminal cleavage/methylation domain-containing protein [Planctomycetia bacterium]
MVRSSVTTVRRGLTLIELVVVVAILAVLAGLVIPKLGFMRERAAAAGAAATQQQLVSTIETYRTSTGTYPMGLDTLTTAAGAAIYGKLWSHDYGAQGGVIGIKTYFAPETVSVSGLQYSQSFGHSFVPGTNGYFFYDHSEATTVTDPSNSAITIRNPTSIGSQKLAFVQSTATDLITSLGYQGGVLPTGTRLVAFGLGPKSNLAEIMASSSRDPAQSSSYYARYIAIFAIYGNGKAAQLKGVVDSLGTTIDSNVNSYNNLAPTVNDAPAAVVVP